MQKIRKLIAEINNKLSSSDYPSNLTDSDYIAYNKSRFIPEKKYICHAPFNNLYFNTEGHIAVCWLTFNNPVHYTENKTLRELWNDIKFQSLREHIKKNDLGYQCHICHKHIKEGNHVNVLSKAYDNDYPLTDFPSIMEFELDNTCNLACTMCNGMLSSTIRRDRENLPPLKSPYGKKFLEELKEFIPHLKEVRFNGGEPFLIKIYYEIWDMILEINPEIKITIATNGTVLNNKVKSYLDRGNFHLNISVDGFSKETYESTRINGNFTNLMQNIEWFKSYCHKHARTLCIMINPMRQNWWEMPDFVNWCNANSVHLWFNTIVRPENQAIWNLPAKELGKIYQKLSKAKINNNSSTSSSLYKYNVKTYHNLVQQQIKTWWEEAVGRENANKPLANKFTDIESLLTEVLPRLNDRKSFIDFLNELNVNERQKVEMSLLTSNSDYLVNELNTKSIDQIKKEVNQFILKG
jgi:MoaA/NifB/PqqE/SkfB family radical SAM enzyme